MVKKFSYIISTIFLINLGIFSGCSTTTYNKETTIESESPIESQGYSKNIKKTTSETTVEENSSGCGGILSCVVNGVGTIIALPFKAVGALLNIIF